MIATLFPIFAQIGARIASSLFPSPEDETRRKEVENAMTRAVLESSAAIEQAAAENVRTEAASSHWLAANWRPLTMLTFLGLIVGRFLGLGYEGMSEAEYLKIWDLMQIGLGGYVIGRSAEKIIPSIINRR